MRDATEAWRRHGDDPATVLADVIRRVEARIVGIAGPPGAGKSTFARAVAEQLGDALVVSTDDYYLSKQERRERGLKWRGPPGSHDVAALVALLEAVRAGRGPITVQLFSMELDDRIDPVTYDVVPRHLLLEGLILGCREDGYAEILERLDLLVFLDVDEETAKSRRFAREAQLRAQGGGFGEEEMQQFWDEVLGPSIHTWVRDAKESADLVIAFGPDNEARSVLVRNDAVMTALRPSSV